MDTVTEKPVRIAMLGLKGLPVRKDSGGVERHVEELGTRLVDRGFEVTAYVRPRFTEGGVSSHRGIRLVRLPSVPTKHLDAITHTFFATIHAVMKGYDIIHYHGVGPSTLAWIPRVFAPRTRIIVTFHSIDRFHQKWGWFARAYLKFGEWTACRFPHVTIAVSRTIREYCADVYAREAVYIPNGAKVKPHPGGDLLAQWRLEPGSYLLTVARLVKQKGIHHLIEAYDGFESEKTLVIAGTEAFGTEYGAQVKELAEGNSNIVFTGFQEGPALAQLFANAYLYVHPSESEGLSVAILEAMGYGRCVLASDIPENLESVGGTGITFVSANAADLRTRIRQLINHPEIVVERGEWGRQWVAKEYDWDGVTDATTKEYERILQEKSRF
jgi:glycosyltransferase involved in cell wall biosynthesis